MAQRPRPFGFDDAAASGLPAVVPIIAEPVIAEPAMRPSSDSAPEGEPSPKGISWSNSDAFGTWDCGRAAGGLASGGLGDDSLAFSLSSLDFAAGLAANVSPSIGAKLRSSSLGCGLAAADFAGDEGSFSGPNNRLACDEVIFPCLINRLASAAAVIDLSDCAICSRRLAAVFGDKSSFSSRRARNCSGEIMMDDRYFVFIGDSDPIRRT